MGTAFYRKTKGKLLVSLVVLALQLCAPFLSHGAGHFITAEEFGFVTSDPEGPNGASADEDLHMALVSALCNQAPACGAASLPQRPECIEHRGQALLPVAGLHPSAP